MTSKERVRAAIRHEKPDRVPAAYEAVGPVNEKLLKHYGYTNMDKLLERYQVRACYYGHLHGASHRLALQGRRGGVEYRLVSADYLKFRPEKILE